MTKKGAARGRGSHLSQAGIEMARSIGAESGPYKKVYTSGIPRTIETAIAMGFAVEGQIDALGCFPEGLDDEMGHNDRWKWEFPFRTFRKLVESGGAAFLMGDMQRDVWKKILEELPAGGTALVISHGRLIEAGLVTCFPAAPFEDWGPAFQHCEGARIHFKDDFSGLDLLRVAHGST